MKMQVARCTCTYWIKMAEMQELAPLSATFKWHFILGESLED
jgi:hypothetical protein